MKEKHQQFQSKFYWVATAALLAFLLGVVACQPQVVEVEVTRIVTETVTETIIEEKEVVEVEVTRVVIEQIEQPELEVVEEADEPLAEEPPVDASAAGGEVGATGSEEGGGSPFVPTAGGQSKIAPTRVASAGWIDMAAVAQNEQMMRLIEESADALIIIHQIDATYGRSTVMIAPPTLYFDQSIRGLPPLPAQELPLSDGWITLLETITPSDQLIEASTQAICDRCAVGGAQETVVLLWPGSGLTITLDQGERLSEIETLLDPLRQVHTQLRQQATLRAFRLGEQIGEQMGGFEDR